MAKFCGQVGYVSYTESSPGCYTEEITEKTYYGDILRHSMRWEKSESINDNININNEISIVSDPYAYQHLSDIRYVKYMDVKWKVTNITIQRPRILLTLGGIYNGE